MCLYSVTECRLKSIHIPCQNNAYSPTCYSVQHTFGCMVCFVLLGGVGIPTEEVEWSGCRNRQSTWTPAKQICTTAVWNQRDHGFIWGWEGGWRSTSSLCLWESGSLFRCINNLINPRRACAAMVTVLGLCVCVSVCLCVCVSVCLSVSTYSRPTRTKPAHQRYQRL